MLSLTFSVMLRLIFSGSLPFERTDPHKVVMRSMPALGSHGVLGLSGVAFNLEGWLTIKLVGVITFSQEIRGRMKGGGNLETFIPQMVALFQEGKLPFDKLICTFPLSQINEAVEAHHNGSAVKVVLIPDESS